MLLLVQVFISLEVRLLVWGINESDLDAKIQLFLDLVNDGLSKGQAN